MEFAFEAASETHRSVHPVKGLRVHSTDTVGGTPVDVCLRDTLALWHPSERVHGIYGAYQRDYLEVMLQRGAVLVLGGDYEKLPRHYRRWTYNDTFDHAVACKTYRIKPGTNIEQTFLYDPLGGGRTFEPYDGEWISLNALLGDYTWKTGSRCWAAIVENKGGEPMRTLNVPSNYPADKEVRVRPNTVVRVAPRTTSERTRHIWSDKKWWPLIGNSTGGWRLIAWDLDDSRKNIGYIYKDDIIDARTVEPPVTQDCEAIKAERDELGTTNGELLDMNDVLTQQLVQYEEVTHRVRDDLATLP